MGPDDEDGDGAAGGEVDWRRWIDKNAPTEKQQKLLDRIRLAALTGRPPRGRGARAALFVVCGRLF
jgi:hypothetical protein